MPKIQPIATGGKKRNLDISYQKTAYILLSEKITSPCITQLRVQAIPRRCFSVQSGHLEKNLYSPSNKLIQRKTLTHELEGTGRSQCFFGSLLEISCEKYRYYSR